MDALRKIADTRGLFIVEDAAHSLESEWNGKKSGHYGDYACFSFYATKSITSGEGGAISVKSEEMYERLKMLRLHGFDKHAVDRYTDHFEPYDIGVFGWKYNMDNIHAAILIEQLRKVDAFSRRREEIFGMYSESLSKVDGIEIHEIRPEASHAFHLFTMLVDPDVRGSVMTRLQEKGIGVSVNFVPLHLMTYYREHFGFREGMFPVAEEIGARTISLPLYPKLTDEEVDYVITSVKEILGST
jgi:dTDP-4-amino-4,6-dideoxygalactose transaminase